MSKTFSSASKNLANENEKHFKQIILHVRVDDDTDATLEDNTFAGITFDKFEGWNIKMINTNAFNKTASKITNFDCVYCRLEMSPPKYDIQKVFNQMLNLKTLFVYLNVSIITSNWIQPINGHESQLSYLYLVTKKNLTIESGAFQNLNQLNYIRFSSYSLKFKKGAFKFNSKSNESLDIHIFSSDLSGDDFESGTFGGIQRNVTVRFETSINYIPESSFKSLLDNPLNKFGYNAFTDPVIDCDDCRNLWLIKQNKQKQMIIFPRCKKDLSTYFFSGEIKNKLNNKCK